MTRTDTSPMRDVALPFDESVRFDGSTLEPSLDQARLGRQAMAVFQVVRDGHWRTLAELAHETGYPEASISARLRDFRKLRFGAHELQRRRVNLDRGQWEYRLTLNPQVRLTLAP